eukprot:TRINITY_DN8224_c0_g1_i1.p1 TRINITY_DN8224_c0_g1~~TRINITY_DN8224_c0_g1_i1.p1  ORF type:complete len:224 (+),score=29.13 TRINITY_DN8224_c0_g1_i1:125-796(+)
MSLRTLFASQRRYWRSTLGRGGSRTEVKNNFAEYQSLESQKLECNHGLDKMQLELTHNESPISKLRLTHYTPQEELLLSRRIEKRFENLFRTRMKNLERSSQQAVFKQAKRLEKHQNRLRAVALQKYPGSRDYIQYANCGGSAPDSSLEAVMREKVTVSASPREYAEKFKNPGTREFENTRGMGYAAARSQHDAEKHLSHRLGSRFHDGTMPRREVMSGDTVI